MFRLSRRIIGAGCRSNAVSASIVARVMSMSSNNAGPPFSSGQLSISKKRPFEGDQVSQRQKTRKKKASKEGSNDEILLADVQLLLQSKGDPIASQTESGQKQETLPERFTEIEIDIQTLSSTGDGLGTVQGSKHVYVVPFCAPGDKVKAKVVRHYSEHSYSVADFVSVVSPSHLRDDSRIGCKYFSNCSGCQFQMLDYDTQLKHKKTIVEKAYRNFSQLPEELIPRIQETIGSPLQYGYRTKLTPHFDGPPGHRSRTDRKNGVRKSFEEMPNIGFMQKGSRRTLDIEDCPIGTEAVRKGMGRERARVAAELDKYSRGATILLRESTNRISLAENDKLDDLDLDADLIRMEKDGNIDLKSCITDSNATSKEYIDSFVFTNPAGSFFQNNNSILPIFTKYVRDHILPNRTEKAAGQPEIKYLIDAYSGSGLFTITLSALFTSSTGIDISGASIDFAKKNATLNGLPTSRANFIAADAPELFKSVEYPNNETVVVIDPPRKGCDESFLSQLLKFAPRRVVYVSCNVHTQARDVGVLVNGRDGVSYKIESLGGFDFFPQTSHVEGVAVLDRVKSS